MNKTHLPYLFAIVGITVIAAMVIPYTVYYESESKTNSSSDAYPEKPESAKKLQTPEAVFITRFQNLPTSIGLPFLITIDNVQNIVVKGIEGTFIFDQTGQYLDSNDSVDPSIHQGMMTYDSDENYYIIEPSSENAKIKKYNPDGTVLLMSFGSNGENNSQFSGMIDVALDKHNNIYATDYGNNRIQVFNQKGDHLLTFGGFGFQLGDTTGPTAIAVDESGNMYVASNYALQKFKPIDFNN
ncbi:MAG: NHL repeat-containing protein [Nitrosopumilaceae archaeon]|nr:NHL repeat-containing protein [Nitrosopumilaceae archaeon]